MKRILRNITLVITSCGRVDLLERTIDSIFKYYFFPKERFVVIDDSGDPKVWEILNSKLSDKSTLILNKTNLGLIKSVDIAYDIVNTEYIFHCEDDWLFYRSGFIENSLDILEFDNKIKQVLLRSIYHDYLINHPVDINVNPIVIKENVCYKIKLKDNVNKANILSQYSSSDLDWSAFSFNPGLLRTADYKEAGKYSLIASSEADISTWYKLRGYYMVILENDACLHTGWGRSLEGHDPKPKYILLKRIKNIAKSFLNLFGFNYAFDV